MHTRPSYLHWMEGESLDRGYRPDCLFGQVPLLEIDGLKLIQSWSTVRYIGSKDGLNSKENAIADMFAEQAAFYVMALQLS